MDKDEIAVGAGTRRHRPHHIGKVEDVDILVDATKPGGADFAERLTIADEQRNRVRDILSAAGVSI